MFHLSQMFKFVQLGSKPLKINCSMRSALMSECDVKEVSTQYAAFVKNFGVNGHSFSVVVYVATRII